MTAPHTQTDHAYVHVPESASFFSNHTCPQLVRSIFGFHRCTPYLDMLPTKCNSSHMIDLVLLLAGDPPVVTYKIGWTEAR